MTHHANQVTTPRYVQAFACIGSTCPITCCGGWQIQVDQATHELWQTIDVEPLRTALRKGSRLIPPEDAPSNANHAQLVFTDDEHCTLLTTEKLCSVHSQLGEAALPRTCRDFPRVYARSAERTSMHCSLGCPEAARLALTDTAAMEMVSAEALRAAQVPFIAEHRIRHAVGSARANEVENERLDCVQASAELYAHAARRLLARPELNAAQA
jgi:lysine-N-methylase